MKRLREDDYTYDQDELDVMEQDIIPLKGICVDGFGGIHPAGTVDRQACLRWIRSAFHHYYALFTSKSYFIIWPFRLLLKLNKLL